MKLKLTFLSLCLAAAFTAIAQKQTPAPSESLSFDKIRSLIVAYPDSALQLLDIAEADKTASLPQYKIDILRGLAYNEKRMFKMKERYARKALASDSINAQPMLKLQALTMLSTSLSFYGQYQQSIDIALDAVKLAREIGNKPSEYNLLVSMSDIAFKMGNRETGYEYLDYVIDDGAKSDNVRDLANVSYAYGAKIIALYTDERYDEALAESENRLAVIDRIDEIGGAPGGYTDQQRAYTYARIASSAEKSGSKDKASDAYRLFLSTAYGKTVEGKSFIVDYLLESKRYAKVLEYTRPLYELFQQYDTINEDYKDLLYSNALAEIGLGNYKAGAGLMMRSAAVQDSLYIREKSSNAQELASLFQLNEKELQLEKARTESTKRHILLIASSAIGIIVLIGLIWLWIQYRRTLRRNRIAVRQINELNEQRESLYNISAENNGGHGSDNESRETFRRMEAAIVEQRMFLDPNLNRDMIARKTGLSRNNVINLIQQFANCTPGDYINKLKIEYSIRLMKQHPEWTIDAVAETAGFNSRNTYYKNFNKFYGITPAQYRKQN